MTHTDIAARLREQAALIEAADSRLMDSLTLHDLDKAHRQLAAAVERTLADAERRLAEGRMLP